MPRKVCCFLTITIFLTFYFLDFICAKGGNNGLIFSKKELTEKVVEMARSLEQMKFKMHEQMLSSRIDIGKLKDEVYDLKFQLEMTNHLLQANGSGESAKKTTQITTKKLKKSKSVTIEFSQKLLHNRDSKHDSDELSTQIDQVFMSESVNSWDEKACHDGLAIIGDDRLIVQNKGTKCGSVFAVSNILKHNNGIFYYEVKLLNDGSAFIGLARKTGEWSTWIGYAKESYGYSSGGHILCNSKTMSMNMPQYKSGDTVGCGVNLITQKLIYTLNGEVLDTKDWTVSSTQDLYPCVTLLQLNTKIEANFGPTYNFGTILAALEQSNNVNLETPAASPSSVETLVN